MIQKHVCISLAGILACFQFVAWAPKFRCVPCVSDQKMSSALSSLFLTPPTETNQVTGSMTPREDTLPSMAHRNNEFLSSDDSEADVLLASPSGSSADWPPVRLPMDRYQPYFYRPSHYSAPKQALDFSTPMYNWDSKTKKRRRQWPEQIAVHKKIPEDEVWATPIIPGEPNDLRKPRTVIRRSHGFGNRLKSSEDFEHKYLLSGTNPGYNSGWNGRDHSSQVNTYGMDSRLATSQKQSPSGKFYVTKKDDGDSPVPVASSDGSDSEAETRRRLPEPISLMWKMRH
ncbi:hypothetical protein D915_000198 [Fasciola hepatica]|uniref:Uncharacterized protein n=1 Tax=Fasciola hepatica TaxID=6192 RepID=A0A4E0S0J3_FASHE|nr:hypothetical protein D915_000198 [Fasciola hepatica]